MSCMIHFCCPMSNHLNCTLCKMLLAILFYWFLEMNSHWTKVKLVLAKIQSNIVKRVIFEGFWRSMLTEGGEAGGSPIKQQQQQQQPEQQHVLSSPNHSSHSNSHTNGGMGPAPVNHLQVSIILWWCNSPKYTPTTIDLPMTCQTFVIDNPKNYHNTKI